MGAENSRRFRGLAVYSTLVGFGRAGYTRILKTQVDLAREIARLIDTIPAFTLLNGHWESESKGMASSGHYPEIATIVLFSAKNDDLNTELAERINSYRTVYVSGTSWVSRPACRIAVSSWQANAKRDFSTVRRVLEAVSQSI